MKTEVDQKKTVVLAVFGIVVVVLAGVNRLFLENTVMSGIVVTLSAIFFIAFIWCYIDSRGAALKAKQNKQNITPQS